MRRSDAGRRHNAHVALRSASLSTREESNSDDPRRYPHVPIPGVSGQLMAFDARRFKLLLVVNF